MPVKSGVQVKTISYVILYVKDTDKALSFYRDILGLKVKSNNPGWVELDTGTTTLALHGESPEASKQSHTGSGTGKAIVCFSVEDIYAAYEALKATGVKIEKAPQQVCEEGDFVGMSVDFHDHDENHLSLYGMVKKK